MSNNPVPGLVRTILPEGFVNFSYYQSLARNEVEPCTPLQQEWFIWILKDKGPNVIDLTQRFAKAYPKIPEEVAARLRVDRPRVKALYELISLTRGSLSLEKVPTFIMIRLLERGGGLEMEAVGPDGSQPVSWENGDIIEISGARSIQLKGDGTWVGIGISYQLAEAAE
jgi:hypothetical protein